MKEIVFSVADIPLSVQCVNHCILPPSFKKFNTKSKESDNNIWHLESLGFEGTNFSRDAAAIKNKIEILKERFNFLSKTRFDWQEKQRRLSCFYSKYPQSLPKMSFYFNDPVEINIRQRKISHFYLDKDITNGIKSFDPRLVTFAYSQILALMHGALLHCSCVVKEGLAFLFFAESGGGKSTVANLSKQYHILGDDIIAIRKIKKKFFAFPTPWRQRVFTNGKVIHKANVRAVFFLKKSKHIHFVPLRPEEALVRTLSQQIHFFLYTEMPMAENIFFTTADFFKNTPAYQMYFRKESNFWMELEKAIK